MLLPKAIDLFLDGYFSTHDRRPKTVAAYTSDLRQFQATFPRRQSLRTVRSEDIESWVLALKRDELAPASIRRKLAVVRIFFNYWVRKETLQRSPLWLLRFDIGKIKPLTRTLTTDEASRLLRKARQQVGRRLRGPTAAIDDAFLRVRDWALIELFLATGMRVGEVTSIRLQDLSLEEQVILVRGKGGRQRLAFLTEPRSYAAISHYHRYRRSVLVAADALFLSGRGLPLTTQGAASALRSLASAAGIDRRVTPHMLRHTSATLLLRNGADLRIVQEFLGHASIATTQRYTHITRAHLLETLQRAHPRLGL